MGKVDVTDWQLFSDAALVEAMHDSNTKDLFTERSRHLLFNEVRKRKDQGRIREDAGQSRGPRGPRDQGFGMPSFRMPRFRF